MSGGSKATTRVAAFFIRSQLTPLLIVVSIVLGLFATWTMPKEEEPTISIPLFDVSVAWPGHTAAEVDERVARPVAAWARELPAVEHVMSSSVDDGTVLIVQFRQGIAREDAFSRLSEHLSARRSLLPSDVFAPTLTSRGVEDVPVLAFSISGGASPEELRHRALIVARAIEQQVDVASVEVIGGARRAFRVDVDPARLAAHRINVDRVVGTIRQAQLELPIGRFEAGSGVVEMRAGSTVASAEDIESLPVAVTETGVVRLRDVAGVRDTVEEPASYVASGDRSTSGALSDSVTLVVSKVVGTNATALTERVRSWMDREGIQQLPAGAEVRVVLDAGKTASERVTTLFEHIGIATLVVVVLIGLALGRKDALIVAIVIPCTLAIVPFVYQVTGFTLNRITLAAMIFAIGILVDDAIVVVENVHRRFSEGGGGDLARLAAEAVGEVANPTILATFAVVSALMPTAFVSGMIGQYLRPLPIGASVAMMYSLLIALTVTPYLAYRILRRAHAGAHHVAAPSAEPWWGCAYGRILAWCVAKPWHGGVVVVAGVTLLFGVLALLPTRAVLVKLLPGSDTTDMGVVVDMPAGTSLSRAHQDQKTLAAALLEIPEVAAVQVYSGRSGPLNFQGVARHYMLRADPHQGEIQIQLTPRGRRSRDSHTVASEIRRVVTAHLEHTGATFTVAEVPPGPPVQAALVAEIYGPTEHARNEAARTVRDAFAGEPSLVDVDSSLHPSMSKAVLRTIASDLSLYGVAGAELVTSQRLLFSGEAVTTLELAGEPERVPVIVQAANGLRARPSDVLGLRTVGPTGELIPIGELARLEQRAPSTLVSRKDLLPVVFVTAEMRGAGAPAYAAIDVTRALRERGADYDIQWSGAAPDATRTTVRWAGEWTTTYELFRDLGGAFAVALALIYVMLVAWYGSYVTPLVVMIPIPLALVGVVPAHLIAGIPLSGMAVIGVIALAGLMVRNSILLVDFARAERAAGHSLVKSVLLASHARVRPILLTAGTVILGDGILFFDPLLQGLGLTMAAGALLSTILTLLLVPTAYVLIETASLRL